MNWHGLVRGGETLLSAVVFSYFLLANAAYTALMALSLRRVWIHVRRIVYLNLDETRHSPATPPVTLIMPAWNEQQVVVETVRSALKTDYPGLRVILVDDGSTDESLPRLLDAFELERAELVYRPEIATGAVRGFYTSSEIPNLLVISKEHGGKFDALNVGINMCRTPYYCTLDSDCMLERDALLRLMRPIVSSPIDTVASGGMVRVMNGSQVKDGQVVHSRLPRTSLERFQVVEYLRGFLFGRTGWDTLDGTLIVSGAFAVYHRESVIEAGGVPGDTVTEDIDLIAQLHRWARKNKRHARMTFTSDPVCWTECPATLANLGRQRRRWELGLCQTLWKNLDICLNREFGLVGLVTFPFYLCVEAAGAVAELLGYVLLPVAFLLGLVHSPLMLLFIALAWLYGCFLSASAVMLEDFTYHRYADFRDLLLLLLYALLENLGYRQIILFYRCQGVVRFLTGFRQWEKVSHLGRSG